MADRSSPINPRGARQPIRDDPLPPRGGGRRPRVSRTVWFWLAVVVALLVGVIASELSGGSSPGTGARIVASAGPGTASGGPAGYPPALMDLHRQAGELLGSDAALMARLRRLEGYPVVLNVWASWCGPCRSEFALFGAASRRYGRRVAFLGADSNDSAPDARSFLARHPVSYPSYQAPSGGLSALLPQGLAGLPTTVFISPAGHVVYVHSGQYAAQRTLDADIEQYALRG